MWHSQAERRYRQLLEEEQRSLARNKKLLEDIDNLEQHMKHFNTERKQDEYRLNHAKDKFLRYVKSVYPKWTEDVKRWQEAKKQPPKNVQRQLDGSMAQQNRSSSHHKSKRHPLNLTDLEESTSYRDRMGYSGDHKGFHNSRQRFGKDSTGPYEGNMEYGKSRSRSTIEYSRDRVDSPVNKMYNLGLSLKDTMEFPPRDSLELPRSEFGYHGSSMYNGGPWLYMQHSSPPGVYSHSPPGMYYPSSSMYHRPYYRSMTEDCGPRWSKPSYGPWTMSYPQARRYEEYTKEDQRDSFKKDCLDNVSFDEKDQGESLTRNGQDHKNYHPRDSTVIHTAEISLNEQGYRTSKMNKVPKDAGQTIDDSMCSPSDRQQARKNEFNVGTNNEDTAEHTVQCSKHFGASEQLRNKLSGHSRNPGKETRVKPKDEENDRTIHSEKLDEYGSNGTDYLTQTRKDGRVMQLRSERSGFGCKDATDSVSLPTIHQYEGDPYDLFSDISSSLPLDQDGSHSKYSRDKAPQNLKLVDSSSKDTEHSEVMNTQELKQSDRNDASSGERMFMGEAFESIASLKDSQVETSPRQDKCQKNETGVAGGGKLSQKVSENLATCERSTGGNSQRHIQKNEVRTSDKLKEVPGSKSNAIEDLIGDSGSDFEASGAELSDDALGELMSATVISSGVRAGQEFDFSSSHFRDQAKETKLGLGKSGLEKIAQGEGLKMGDSWNNRVSISESNSPTSGEINHHKESAERLPLGRNERKHLGQVLSRGSMNEDDFFNEDAGVKKLAEVTHSRDLSCSEELKNESSKNRTNGDGGKNTVSIRGIKAAGSNSKEMVDTKDAENRMKGDHGLQEKINGKNLDISVKENAISLRSREEGRGEAAEGNTLETDEDRMVQLSKEVIGKDVEDGVSEDGNSVVLEELSFSSGKSSSVSVPTQSKGKSETKTKESVMSYSEDFDGEQSIPLTQSAAYQKMLSAVDVSDEDDDLENVFLQGTMPEANNTAQSTLPQKFQDSENQTKLPAKSSKPTLSLFNSGERDNFENSLKGEGVLSDKGSEGLLSQKLTEDGGGLSASLKSSEMSPSPPLSPSIGYTPSVPEARKVETREDVKKKEGTGVSAVHKKLDTGKDEARRGATDTKSRIKAGFWNHSDSESEVDLQISHGEYNEDDDDDFDFYS